jgi:phage internal scaffolding protein
MSTKTQIRKPYDPHPRVTLDNDDPSLAKQSMKAECDINNIMKQFSKTGLLLHTNKHQGQYGDFITSTDYHEAMDSVLEAREAFDSLPSKIRLRFQNDPAQFLEFVQNPDNSDELVKMGLAKAPPSASKAPPEPETGPPVRDPETPA